MKIKAEDVIFIGKNGKETDLLHYMHDVIETMQMIKQESINAKYMVLEDENGDTNPLEDVIWGCINAIEDLNDRLSALEARKANKLN